MSEGGMTERPHSLHSFHLTRRGASFDVISFRVGCVDASDTTATGCERQEVGGVHGVGARFTSSADVSLVGSVAESLMTP